MADFFIRRPIVAMVIAILTVIVGAISLSRLPISEYPPVSPTMIQVTTTYRGAAAEAVMESVATPIESKVNGVDKLLYMQSYNANDGKLILNVYFDVGTDVDIMQVNTQNRVGQAEAQLPEAVKKEGVIVNRSSPDILMVIGLYSPKGTYDAVFLGNYCDINPVDAIKRVKGVGDVKNFTAQDYSMRVWLRPDKLAVLGITPQDIQNAIREQNAQSPAGRIGAEPAPPGQEMQFNVRALGLLKDPSEFAEIIIRSNPDGSQVKIKDVGRVELAGGINDARSESFFMGRPTVGILIIRQSQANLLDVANRIKALLPVMQKELPEGVRMDFRPGSLLSTPKRNDQQWAEFEAAACDVTIAVLGFTNLLEGEEGDAIASATRGDREDLLLPEPQRVILRSLLERGLLWYASPERLKRLIHVEGEVHLAETSPYPVMWLVPHFVGVDIAGIAMQLYQDQPGVDIYAPQSNPVLDAALLQGRQRLGNAEFYRRQDGARAVLRAIRRGHAFFNPADMDFGPRDAAFVPFFGQPAATLLAPSRMARSLNMLVQPVVAEMLPGGRGYVVRMLEPWRDWPTDDPEADAAEMNHRIEALIRACPAQYLWVHRRFKTRPPGAPPVY